MDPQQLRKELQEANTPDLQKRRGIIVASLAGIASMAAVTLLQTGIVKHLPDPPLGNFDSDNVNSSDTAYRFGLPDGPVSLAALALNIPIAAFGGANRPQKYPWLAIIAAAKQASKPSQQVGTFIRCRKRKRRGAGTASSAPSRIS